MLGFIEGFPSARVSDPSISSSLLIIRSLLTHSEEMGQLFTHLPCSGTAGPALPSLPRPIPTYRNVLTVFVHFPGSPLDCEFLAGKNPIYT